MSREQLSSRGRRERFEDWVMRHPRIGLPLYFALLIAPCVAFPFAYEALVRWVH